MSTQAASREIGTPNEATLALSENRGRLLALGMVLMVLGYVAIAIPTAVSVSIVWIFGVVLAGGGIAQFILAFRSNGTDRFLPMVLSATLYLLFGTLLLANPFPGPHTAVLLVVAFLAAEGAFKILMAERPCPARQWHWLMFSGLLAMAFGLILLAVTPCAAFSMLGTLIAIDLAITGGTLIVLSLASNEASCIPPGK